MKSAPTTTNQYQIKPYTEANKNIIKIKTGAGRSCENRFYNTKKRGDFLNYSESVNYIKSKIDKIPETAVVLGSGYSDLINNIKEKTVIKYQNIPNFQKTTVHGHSGEMIFSEIDNKEVIFMAGRFHLYEGHSMQEVTYYVRVLKLLGVKNLILTNAAGGVNENYNVGDLVVITDHIKLALDSPLFGKNDKSFGERFFDMTESYDKKLIETAKEAFLKNNTEFKTGVYALMGGPQFETPAEIKMLKILGADMVGMSTIPEVITARHAGINVLGISLISNMAAGISQNKLSHAEVMEEGKKATSKFWNILMDII